MASDGSYSGPKLPEDIWCHIHHLMPMRDAAQVACVSRAFACFWRCHPNLVFTKGTLGLNENACNKDRNMTDFSVRVDHILKKHSGIGVKTFKLEELEDMLLGPVPYCISDDTMLFEDPMRIEAQLMTLTTEKTTASICGGSHISHALGENWVPPTDVLEHNTYGPASTTEEALQLSNQGAGDTSHHEACNTSGLNLENFLKTVTTSLQPPILSTPVKKKRPVAVHDGDENTVRRSERIAEKKKARGNKNMEQLAEEAVAKKLDALSPSKNLTQEARERYLKMLDGPLTQEAMDAIEDLLKAMNLNKVKVPKKGKKKVIPGEA